MHEKKKTRRLTLPPFQTRPNEPIEFSGEEQRLGQNSPLSTILVLSFGPFMSQTVQALYGIINLFWVSKSIGSKGLEVFGAIYVVDFITLGFSTYLMTSIDIRVSYLFGEKSKVDECSQIFIDFIRFSFILALFMPLIILPITRPLIEWFGSDKELSKMCLEYMYPNAFGAFFNFLYMSACGLIQSEGRSVAFGVAQVVSLILNMVVFCPFFLLYLKTDIWGASLATVISQGIVGLVLVILIFMGKYTIKPKMIMFCRKFSPESWASLKIGFASLVSNFTVSLPEILLQKFLNMAATAVGEYETVIKVWGVIEKLYQFVGGANDAFSIGFLPAASYAYGAHRYNRVLRLFMHTNWVTILISVVYSIFMIFFSAQISSIWDKNEDFLEKCESMIPKVFYITALFPIQYTVPALLQSMQKVALSSIVAGITSMLPIPLFSCILYYTDKKNPDRIMWTYCLSDVFASILCFIFIIPSMKKLWPEQRDELITNPEDIFSSVRSIKSENCCSTPLLEDGLYKE